MLKYHFYHYGAGCAPLLQKDVNHVTVHMLYNVLKTRGACKRCFMFYAGELYKDNLKSAFELIKQKSPDITDDTNITDWNVMVC